MCSIVSDSLQPSGLPGFSVHVIFQARILEQAAISYYTGTSYPEIKPFHLLHWQPYSLPSEPHGKLLVAATAAKSLQSCPTLCDPIDSL